MPSCFHPRQIAGATIASFTRHAGLAAVKVFFTKLGAAWDRFLDVSLVISAAAVVLASLLTLSDITSRQFFASAQGWAIEIAEYCLLYLAFFGAAWLLREDGHVKVEVVVEVLSARNQAFLGMVTSVVGVLVTGVLAYFATSTTIMEYMAGTKMYESPLKPPLYPLLIPIPIGAASLCIQFMRRTWGCYRRWQDPGAGTEGGE